MRLLAIIAKLSFAAVLVSALIGAVAAFGTRFGIWNYGFGLLTLFPWCVYFGIAAFALGAVWAIGALIGNVGAAARYGAIGLIGSILIAGPPLYRVYLAQSLPAIHDISTDTENPPQFIALKNARPGATNPPGYDGAVLTKGPEGETEATWELQKKYYSDIRAASELTSPDNLFRRAVKSAYAMGWNVVAVDPKDGRIEATHTSFWFGLTDDIVIRVKPAGQGARLDIRSKSRAGVSDYGENADRINAYKKTLASTF
jgi:hypothetical protein